MNNVENAVSAAGSQVVDQYAALFAFHLLKRLYVAIRQIHNVNIIPDTRSIRGIVIISEDTERFQLADCNLGDIWKQIVRNSLRVLTDSSRFMSSDRIEIAQKHDIPLRIGRM